MSSVPKWEQQLKYFLKSFETDLAILLRSVFIYCDTAVGDNLTSCDLVKKMFA